jgi:hypothetical protein
MFVKALLNYSKASIADFKEGTDVIHGVVATIWLTVYNKICIGFFVVVSHGSPFK